MLADERAPGTLLSTDMEGTLRFRSRAVDADTGTTRDCVVLVDSGSNVNLTRPWCVHEAVESERPLTVKALKQQLQVSSHGEVVLMLPDTGDTGHEVEPVGFACYVLDQIGPPSLGIDVLLNAAAGYELGYLAEKPSAAAVPHWKLPKLYWRRVRSARKAGGMRTRPPAHRRDGAEALMAKRLRREEERTRSSTPVHDRLVDRVCEEMYAAMADAAVGEILKTKSFPLAGEKCYSPTDIQWGKVGIDHTAEQRRVMERLIDEYADVFSDEAFPAPCACEPVDIPLKDAGSKLPFDKVTEWKPHHREFLKRARRQLESFGILTPTDRPAGASRVTLATKDGGKAARLCIDLRRVNKLLKEFQCIFRDGPAQVERVSSSKHRFRSSFDLASAYSQLRPNEESKRLLTVILPDDDGNPTAYTYNRLPFGLQTSGAYLQRYLEEVFAELPSDLKADGLYYYVDDVVLVSATWDDHLRHVRAFFDVCRKRKLKVSYKKAQCLVREVTFFGMRCSPDGTKLSDENTAALRRLQYPTNVSQMRHVIGIFGVARRFVPDFAHHMEPLIKLTRKGIPWRFGGPERAAFEHVRGKLVEGVQLHAFDASMPLVLSCDASGVAEGGWLAQQDKNGTLHTIAFFSKSFSPTMRRAGATAREAHAAIYALNASRLYCHSSPFPVTVFTDCRSLTFVRDSTNSELSSRFLDKVQDIDYVLRYRKGSENTVCDAFSRLESDGPDALSPAGTATALDDLLEHLDGSPVQRARNVWVHVAEYTDEAYRLVQAWRGRAGVGGAMSKAAPTEETLRAHHDLRVLRFAPHVAVEMARVVLKQPIPTALLLPLDLIGQVGADRNGPIPDILEAVRAAKKRAYVGSNALWILHCVENAEDDVCLTTTLTEVAAETDPLAPNDGPRGAVNIEAPDNPSSLPDGDVVDHQHYGETRHLLQRMSSLVDITTWPDLQVLDGLTTEQTARVLTDQRGLKWIRRKKGPSCVIVPERFRPLILQLAHTESNHASVNGLVREIKRNYFWPTLKADCKQWVDVCERCAIGNVRRVLSHNLYASSSYTMPRQVVGLDFKKITVGGETAQLLLMVDRFSGFATLAVMPERTAACTIQALDEEFFSIFGPPRKLTVDGAPEFRSEALRTWVTAQGCELVPPLEFYPNAAGATERVWVMIRTTLRRTKDFSAWRAELRQAVYQYNAMSRDERPSPFSLFFGGEPNTVSSMQVAALRPPTDPNTNFQQVLSEGTAATHAQEAADGDLRRRARAVSLNQAGRRPRTYRVGDAVWFWQNVSGGVNRGDDRPRTATTPWQAGVVSAVSDVRISVRPLARGRGRRAQHERHVSHVKPRNFGQPAPTEVPDEGDAGASTPTSDPVSQLPSVADSDPVSQLPSAADAAESGPVSIAQQDPVSAPTRRKRGRPRKT